jgi:hypothetical protein
MGVKCVALVAALIVCMAAPAFATMSLGSKNIANQQFPTPNMSGNEIMQEATYGSNPTANNSELSFRNESLFYISKSTGMTPGVGTGVRTPVVAVPIASIAGSWSLRLTDVNTKLLTLTLFQSGDAVFGSGELTADGSVSQVAVGGTILGDQLALFVTPETAPNNLYRLSLTIGQGSMDGSYIYSAPGITQPGVAFGNAVSLPAPPFA